MMFSLWLLYCSICIYKMSFILAFDVNALCKYIGFLSSMINSIGSSQISPSSAGFGIEIGSFNVVLIMVICMSVKSLISSRLMYQVSHPYKSASSIVACYSFINVPGDFCESISFLVV